MSRATSFIAFLESDIETAINKAITGEQDREKKAHELLKAEAIKRPMLTSSDISTIHDLDIYRYQKAYKGNLGYIPSRFNALKELYGEEKADVMLRNLEVGSWDLRKKVPHYRGPKFGKGFPIQTPGPGFPIKGAK